LNSVLAKNSVMKEKLTRVKLDEVFNLSSCNIDAHCVIGLDQWVWIANSTTITGYNAWNTLQSNQQLLHLAQLVLPIHTVTR
jgi:hypothetical protein